MGWGRTGALETFTQAVASLHAAGNLLDELSGTIPLADMWCASGRPSKARRLYARALSRSSRRRRFARAAAGLHVGMSELDAEVGDLESAKRHLDAAAALADRAGMNEGRSAGSSPGHSSPSRRRPRGGHALLDQAVELYRPGFSPEVRPITAFEARIWITQGDLAEAADWARDRGVSVTDDASYLREFDHLTLVRLLLAQSAHTRTPPPSSEPPLVGPAGRVSRGRGARRKPPRDPPASGAGPGRSGTSGAGSGDLGPSTGLAPEPEGYLRLFLDEGAPMLSLLRDAQACGLGGHRRDACSRRRSGRRCPGPEHGAGVPRTAVESLRERELQVLRLLDSELTGPQIARTLFVSHNTVRTHTQHIFTKLDVTTRRAAVLRARERGLI